MDILTVPLTAREVAERTSDGKDRIQVVLAFDLDDLISKDRDEINDLAAESIHASGRVNDIGYEVVGNLGDTVYVWVSGDVREILADDE